jgi:hypothetical protein
MNDGTSFIFGYGDIFLKEIIEKSRGYQNVSA